MGLAILGSYIAGIRYGIRVIESASARWESDSADSPTENAVYARVWLFYVAELTTLIYSPRPSNSAKRTEYESVFTSYGL